MIIVTIITAIAAITLKIAAGKEVGRKVGSARERE